MRKRSSVIALLLVAVLVLAACSNSVPKSQTKVEPNGAFTTIRVAYPKGYGWWVDVLVQGFQTAHKEYRITPVPLETDYEGTMRGVVTDKKADLVIVNALPYELISGNLATDLDPYIRKSNMDMGGYKLEQSQYLLEGKLLGLPLIASPRALYGNADLFKQADVPVPEGTWTWDEFRVAAQKLTNTEKKQWGIDSKAPELLAQLRLLQYDVGTPANLASEKAWNETLQFWTTVTLTDRSTPPVARDKVRGPLQRSGDPVEYAAGKAAMALLRAGSELPAPHVILPMPTLPGAKPVTYTWFYTAAIPYNSDVPDAAWEFIRYAAGPDGALEMAKNGILPMYVTPAVEEAWLKTQPKGAEAILKSRWMSHFSSKPFLNDMMDQAINKALSGSEPWEKVAADYVAQTEAYRTGK